jgi:hypothetical protein
LSQAQRLKIFKGTKPKGLWLEEGADQMNQSGEVFSLYPQVAH